MNRLAQLLVVLALSAGAGATHALPVTVDGRQWLQPADFTNITWYTTRDVCDPITGVCTGQLAGHDLTGYTWASVDDINGLLNYFLPGDPLGPGPSELNTPVGTFINLMLAQGFTPVIDDPTGISAFTRTVYSTVDQCDLSECTAYVGWVQLSPGQQEQASSLVRATKAIQYGVIGGGWFFKELEEPPGPVPVPPTLLLIGLALAVLGYSRHKL